MSLRKLTVAVALSSVLVIASCTSKPANTWVSPAPGSPASPAPSGAPVPEPFGGWWDPAANLGKPYGTKVNGLITFRGNPTRTFYGTGDLPRSKPKELWRFPQGGNLCSLSSDRGEIRQWCGTGYTGQPSVFERDGRTWVVFGAYDAALHFLDAKTGQRIIPDLKTGDIIKGSVSIDPDGFPLVYSGSRDNLFRIVSFDQGTPKTLWSLHSEKYKPTKWNNDWDASPLIMGDYLFEGSESSRLFIIKLNKKYGANGKVTVDPKVVWHAAGWDAQLMKDLRGYLDPENVSIEGAVTIVGNTMYHANSGGLLQGWDIGGLKEGKMPTRVFRFWLGDDSDGSIVADETGMLYVGVEYERQTARAKQLGQMLKIDPKRTDNPVVWSVKDTKMRTQHGQPKGGVFDSAALYKDLIIWGTNSGRIIAIDRASGTVRWEVKLPIEVAMSPVVVNGTLVVADCSGLMNAYDITDTASPPKPLWSFKPTGSCIESTPAVWNGVLYFGTRGGGFHAFG